MPKGQPVTLEARVSEGPEQRVKIKQQLVDMLKAAGADPAKLDVKVLCTYKSGYSWLVDDIEPSLKGTGVAKIKIEFAPYPDPTKQSTMRSLYRWNQELFPVDEIMARDLQIPAQEHRDCADGRRQGAHLQGACLWRRRQGDADA